VRAIASSEVYHRPWFRPTTKLVLLLNYLSRRSYYVRHGVELLKVLFIILENSELVLVLFWLIRKIASLHSLQEPSLVGTRIHFMLSTGVTWRAFDSSIGLEG